MLLEKLIGASKIYSKFKLSKVSFLDSLLNLIKINYHLKMLKFNYKSFILFLFLLIIEVIIALYVTQHFIRHTLGDYLCVIMLFHFIKSFVKIKSIYIAITVLLAAYTIEILQLTAILDYLKIEDTSFIRIIFGSTFSVSDLIAYTLGVVTVLIIEKA